MQSYSAGLLVQIVSINTLSTRKLQTPGLDCVSHNNETLAPVQYGYVCCIPRENGRTAVVVVKFSNQLFSLLNFKARSETDMRDIAARICRDYLTGAWKTIPAEDLQLRRISGGLSNFLYYVSLPEDHQQRSDTPRSNYSSGSSSSKRARKDSYSSMLEPKEVSCGRKRGSVVGLLLGFMFWIRKTYSDCGFQCID